MTDTEPHSCSPRRWTWWRWSLLIGTILLLLTGGVWVTAVVMPLETATIELIDRLITPVDPFAELARAYQVETLVIGDTSYATVRKGISGSVVTDVERLRQRSAWFPLLDYDQATYLTFMTDTITALRAHSTTLPDPALETVHWRYLPVTGLILPATDLVVDNALHLDRKRRLLALVAATTRVHHETGSWPDPSSYTTPSFLTYAIADGLPLFTLTTTRRHQPRELWTWGLGLPEHP